MKLSCCFKEQKFKMYLNFCCFFKKINVKVFFKGLYLFLEGGGRERNIHMLCDTNSNQLHPSPHPKLGTWPTAQALTRNQTCNLLVHRLVLNPLSHTSQGKMYFNFCRAK